jgi:peptide/nickel transport system permease protein
VSIGSFLLRRLGSGALAILGVSILVFLFLHLVPGDPVDHLAGGEVTLEQRQKIEQCMGLAERVFVLDASVTPPKLVQQSEPVPFALQFVGFLGNIVDGSLGHQCPDPKGKPTVAARIAEVFPHTIYLALCGMIVAIVLALPLGIAAAIKRGTWIDTLATTTSLSGIALPQMMFAPLLVLWGFITLGWFPGPTETGPSAIVLPALAIGTHMMAMLARMTRSSLVETLGDDYVRTARAKGLSEPRVIVFHALRNALLPVITIVGLQFGSLLSGAIIIENVFSRPGLGSTLVDAIRERNYPIVQGTVLVIAVIYVVVNTLVDLTYGLVDPRIRRA